MIIEICANGFESAVAAQEAGADRIELCTELSVGGLTPSYGLIKKVMETLSIPVHVLIRPRSGNFTYTQDELDIMLKDIKFCEGLGCAGIVSGALTAEHAIDRETTSALKAASGAMEFTFHRAFDWCPDPLDALEKLKSIQVTRLLTSGQETTAEDGIPLLIELKELAKSQLQIMPGGGISIENCMHFKNAGFNMVHLSATKKTQSLSTIPRVSMHAPKLFEEGIIATSDASIISAVVKKLKR